jgi:hypothetical protein
MGRFINKTLNPKTVISSFPKGRAVVCGSAARLCGKLEFFIIERRPG